MKQDFKKNEAFNSSREPDEFRRNSSPEKGKPKALAVVQDLYWGSILPLLAVYFKYGPFLIYYQNASRGGLRLGHLLHLFRLATSNPLEILDLYYCDTRHVIFWNTQHQVHKACQNEFDRIEALIKKHSPKSTVYIRKLLAKNVGQAWQNWLNITILLRSVANQLGIQEKIPTHRVILVSRYASLLKILNLDAQINKEVVWSQPNKNRSTLYPLATIVFSIIEIVRGCYKHLISKKTNISKSSSPFKIGVAAAWGADGMDKIQKDDLYWWRNSSISGDRLIYMFERENIQPTRDGVAQVKNLGIDSVALNPKFPGDYPNLLIQNNLNHYILGSIKQFFLMAKLAWKNLFADEFPRAVLALVSWQYYYSGKLSNIYKTLNLKGVFHFEEGGMDLISLASAMNDSIRIGTHWGSHTGITSISARNHQVYFCWGLHDAKFAVDAGSMARSLLIAGCFSSDHSNIYAHQKASKIAAHMRKRGVRYIVTLFDSSPPSPEFHRFFLQWLLDDPRLGILIKSKGKTWEKMHNHGLNGLVDLAFQTNRIHAMDQRSSPADAASISDFAISLTSITPLNEAALNGSRVIFLDYERIDQGPQKPYCILHSLGSNRCVFYEPELLREAILNYFENPETNPFLGDATPILDQLDPFRDGKASQRIGEFVASYLQELDNGLSSDDAVRLATDRYAKKWGQDKVIRRI